MNKTEFSVSVKTIANRQSTVVKNDPRVREAVVSYDESWAASSQRHEAPMGEITWVDRTWARPKISFSQILHKQFKWVLIRVTDATGWSKCISSPRCQSSDLMSLLKPIKSHMWCCCESRKLPMLSTNSFFSCCKGGHGSLYENDSWRNHIVCHSCTGFIFNCFYFSTSVCI